jgi:hypothetical protein
MATLEIEDQRSSLGNKKGLALEFQQYRPLAELRVPLTPIQPQHKETSCGTEGFFAVLVMYSCRHQYCCADAIALRGYFFNSTLTFGGLYGNRFRWSLHQEH